MPPHPSDDDDVGGPGSVQTQLPPEAIGFHWHTQPGVPQVPPHVPSPPPHAGMDEVEVHAGPIFVPVHGGQHTPSVPGT